MTHEDIERHIARHEKALLLLAQERDRMDGILEIMAQIVAAVAELHPGPLTEASSRLRDALAAMDAARKARK